MDRSIEVKFDKINIDEEVDDETAGLGRKKAVKTFTYGTIRSEIVGALEEAHRQLCESNAKSVTITIRVTR